MSANKEDFGQKMEKLEAIVEWFDEQHTDMTQSIKKFEEGMKLTGELKKELQQLENKVEKIKQDFSD